MLTTLQIKPCSMHEMIKTCVTVLMQVTNKLHSCCMWQLNIVLFCVQQSYQSIILLYIVWNLQMLCDYFFLSFSGSGTHALFHVYFSSFLITRYRTNVIYSWKGLLGELSNTYESPNYNHTVCVHSVHYMALWLCYIMFPKSTEID
jgi:hypothetical protein